MLLTYQSVILGGDYSGDDIELIPPTNVQVSGCDSLSAYLTWRGMSGVSSYHIYVSALDSLRGIGEKYIPVSGVITGAQYSILLILYKISR